MMINEVVRYDLDGSIAVVTVDSPPVNTLSAAVRRGLAQAVEMATANDRVDAIIILCAGRSFFAGADITEFGKPAQEPSLRDLLTIIENASRPVITAIHGTALGGGLELALASHFRVGVPSARCGLPEVNLGLLPGAGGTQRLPRIVGVETALEMVATGVQLGAAKARALGLFDDLVAEGQLRAGAIAFARRIVAEQKPLLKVRDRIERLNEARERPGLFTDFRARHARRFRGFLAPEYTIRAVEAALVMPFEDGLIFERSLFDELMADSQSAAQRHIFFAERKAGKVDDVPAETPILPITHVGVIGAGTMGAGIAMNFLSAGIPVTLVETGAEAVERGVATMRANYEATARKGKLDTTEIELRMSRLTPSIQFDDLAGCDLIIEAVFEQMDIKKAVFARLDQIAKPDAILATNTSYLDIDEIARSTNCPERVIGLHFFSPANVMRLLEIVRTDRTAQPVIATALSIARKIGKLPVVVRNGFGFVGNRILAARNREADKLILEGATPTQIDKLLYDFGFAMGHFQMRDLVGLDVGWNRATTTSASVREILNEMGRHGQKSRGGYYDYDDARTPTPSPVSQRVIEQFAKSKAIVRRPVDDDEVRDRLLYAMVNEGASILDEGIAARASDIDVIWITGYGWPRYRGGPMFWADLQGMPIVLARLRELQARHGDDFRPSPLIERLAVEGKAFADL